VFVVYEPFDYSAGSFANNTSARTGETGQMDDTERSTYHRSTWLGPIPASCVSTNAYQHVATASQDCCQLLRLKPMSPARGISVS